jgi:hypothetical protein
MNICFIDPPSEAYDNERFFDINNSVLNRDDGLLPYYNLKNDLEKIGYLVTTFDNYLKYNNEDLAGALYISFGRLRSIELLNRIKLRLFAFFLLEPPLVDKKMYNFLPSLTKAFQNVFIHNTSGNCYNLENVDSSKLRKLYWPQPQAEVNDKCWNNTNRYNKIVLINGHHKPKSYAGKELYSERIKWAIELDKTIGVDLYGRGWTKIFARSSFWLVYLLNFKKIKNIYIGPCESKIVTMSQYTFALCFENLRMDGYITEKIFDCFFAGTIPIYWGGSDIEKWIPANCYIDIRKFINPENLALYLKEMPNNEILSFRKNAKNFVESEKNRKYFNIFLSLKEFL